MGHTNRIKLLKFVANFSIGGTEQQVLNFARRLDASRFELSFGCLNRLGELLQETEGLRIPLAEYKINCLYNYKAFKERVKFAKDLRRRGIQIVHTYGLYANLFAIPAARLAGTPVVVASIRDTGAYSTPIKNRAQRLICHLAGCILVNSEAGKQWLIAEGYDPKKIAVIANGIDLSRFTRSNGDGKLQREFGLPPGCPVVAVLSRLNSLKGIEYFLEAAAMVAEGFPQARFVVIGDDGRISASSYKKELEDFASRLGLQGRVVFTGFRLDVSEVLSEVTVSVLPSLSEGLSNTLLESMAAGLPVVATTVGGNPEVVQDGATGLLVPPRDSAALAQAISLLLENPEMALSFGEAGRRRVAECFSLERMVEKTEHLYLRLLEEAA